MSRTRATADVIDLTGIEPVGSIHMYAGAAAPTGYLFCNGDVISQTTYASLFAVVGSAYNTGGEGAGNFRLPDFRAMFPRGASMGATGTIQVNSLNYTPQSLGTRQSDATARKGLTITDSGHSHNITVYDDFNSPAGNLVAGHNNGSTPNTGATQSATAGVTLGAGDAETRPINLSVNFIIKF